MLFRCLGMLNPASRNEYLRIIADLATQGAQAIILGCTEISLLVDQRDVALPLFDTTSIHARMAAEFALSDSAIPAQLLNRMDFMPHQEIQEQLNIFYAEAIAALKEAACFTEAQQLQLSSPFLLKVPRAYFDAPIRILFVGQETAGWAGKLRDTLQRDDPVGPLLQRYSQQMEMPTLGGPFFRKFQLVEKQLGGGTRGSIIWSNLQRMDVKRGHGQSRNSRDYSSHLDAFSERLNRHELELLQPDVMIFGCGPNYDKLIKRYFPEYETSRVVEKRALWHFSIGKTRCYRTWHPRTTNHKGIQSTSWYYDEIISDIKASFPAVYR